MKRVMIVDDEKRIGTLVKNLIRWTELDMECTGVYDHGEDALEAVRTSPPGYCYYRYKDAADQRIRIDTARSKDQRGSFLYCDQRV